MEKNWFFFLHPVNYDGYVRENCMLKWTRLSFCWIIHACMLFAGVWQCADSSRGQPVFGGTESFPWWRHHERPSWTVWSQVRWVHFWNFYWLKKSFSQFSSLHFKMVSMCLEKPTCTSPYPSKNFPNITFETVLAKRYLLETLFKNLVENCITCVTHSSGLRHCQV